MYFIRIWHWISSIVSLSYWMIYLHIGKPNQTIDCHCLIVDDVIRVIVPQAIWAMSIPAKQIVFNCSLFYFHFFVMFFRDQRPCRRFECHYCLYRCQPFLHSRLPLPIPRSRLQIQAISEDAANARNLHPRHLHPDAQ